MYKLDHTVNVNTETKIWLVKLDSFNFIAFIRDQIIFKKEIMFNRSIKDQYILSMAEKYISLSCYI